MTDNDPSHGRPHSTGTGIGQRLLALLVFALLAYLIWLAVTGQYDTEVNRVAAWLHRLYTAVAHRF
jgi:hypothetical protein